MRKLILEKPICFFDAETTGINTLSDKIVSLSIIKINPDWTREKFYAIMNPGCIIPDSASVIHGITTQMVADKPFFNEYAETIENLFNGSDIGGFNSNNFDIPLLSIEMSRVGITFPKVDAQFIDVCNLFKKLNPRNLTAAVARYTNQDLENAHNAEADNEATINVFLGMLNEHEDLPLTISEIAQISNHGLNKVDIMGKFIINESGHYIYSFGKHKGERVTINNVSFIGWMLQPDKDFHPNTIMWAKKIYNEIIPEGPAHLPF